MPAHKQIARDMCIDEGSKTQVVTSLRTVVMPPDLRLGITMGSYNGAARPSPGQVCTVRHMGLILGDQDSCVTSL